MIPKNDGTHRFILNLKKLNNYIDPQHFKMEDVRTACKLLSKSYYMAHIDLKEAYFLIPIHENSKKYLRFKFFNQTYEFQCLPFGLCSAPLIFTKLMKPVATYLRKKGIMLVIYLDDLLCINKTFESCSHDVKIITDLLEKLGFVININKSDLVPSQLKTFLGFELNSTDMTLKLPLKKRLKVLEMVDRYSNKRLLPIRDFAKFLGLLTSSCPAVSYGWVYTKRFERTKYIALQKSNEDYDVNMIIPNYLEPDFSWWKTNIMNASCPIRQNKYYLEIFSDASLTGWGIACNGETSGGFWSTSEAQNHINLLELKAAFIGLRCFAKDLVDKEILLRIDNTTAISYINRMGGVQYTHLNDIAREIWQWCEERRLFIFASYIKSKDNTEADQESRHINVDTEWELSRSAFHDIVLHYGTPEIDLFATCLNAKCHKYVSWKRDPHAFDIDAFTLDWGNLYFYSFPPFSLILKCLRKIITDKATGVLIVPYWPSQPWYPLFTSLQIRKPVYHGPSSDLLLSPFRTQHPLWMNLTLVSCLLSGKHFFENH